MLSELKEDEIIVLEQRREELIVKFGERMQEKEFNLALKGGKPSALKSVLRLSGKQLRRFYDHWFRIRKFQMF